MALRLSGDKNAFWDNAAVGAGGTSAAIELPRGGEQFTIYVAASAATTITVQVAHSGDLSTEGILSDPNAGTWHNLNYVNTPVTLAMAGSDAKAMQIPDFNSRWVRLSSSGAATITAGWELSGG
jgi:hypothetical protein